MRRYARQHPLYAAILFTFADLPSGVFVPMVDLPPGSIELPLQGFIDVSTASNAGTTDALAVGPIGTPTSYLAAGNFKAVGRLPFTVPSGPSVDKQTVGITRTAVGTAATAGAGCMVIGYVQNGQQHTNQGPLDGTPLAGT